jgi:hypothetical protein
MNNEYSVWLFFVGVALGAAAVWLALARLPRQADDMGPDERAAAADWISSTISAHGGIAPVALVEQVLDLNAEYLSGSPGPVARSGVIVTEPYSDTDDDPAAEAGVAYGDEPQERHDRVEAVRPVGPAEPPEPTFEDLERELAEAVAARHHGDGVGRDGGEAVDTMTTRYKSRGGSFDEDDLLVGHRLAEEPVTSQAEEAAALDAGAFQVGGGTTSNPDRSAGRRNPREQRDPRSR